MRGIVFFVVLAAATGVAACGKNAPSGSGSDAADFRAQADASCVDFAERVRDSRIARGPASDRQARSQARREAAIRRRAQRQQRGIRAPREFRRDWTRFLKAPEGARRQDVARKMGLEDCARVLSSESREEVRDVEAEILTTSDPSQVCDELLVDGTAQVLYGSFEMCRRFQRNPSNSAERLRFFGIEGIDEVVATVEVQQVGGGSNGQRSIDTLYFVDGEWRLFDSVAR